MPAKTIAVTPATHAALSEFREKNETLGEAVARAIKIASGSTTPHGPRGARKAGA